MTIRKEGKHKMGRYEVVLCLNKGDQYFWEVWKTLRVGPLFFKRRIYRSYNFREAYGKMLLLDAYEQSKNSVNRLKVIGWRRNND